MERNKFFVFCFSFIPGAGQMYLGMMKKGMAVMAAFFGLIFVAVMLSTGILSIFLPVIWFYSFFDTFNNARYNADQRLQMDYKFWEDCKKGIWVPRRDGRISKNTPKYLGIGCILLGAYSLYQNAIRSIYWYFDVPNWLYYMTERLPGLFVAIAIIGLGVYLLKKTKKDKDVEEFIEYQEGRHE